MRIAARHLALVAIMALPGGIPGVPESCCGWQDCRPASVHILKVEGGKALVRIDGKTITIPASTAVRSRFRGFYCFVKEVPQCWDGKNYTVSRECARCAIESGSFVEDVRVIETAARGHLVLPVYGDCGQCHGG